MKNQKVIIALSSLLLALIIAGCDQKTTSKSGNKNPAVTIDDEVITIGQYEDFYYAQNKLMMNIDRKQIDTMAQDPQAANHPTLSKSKFADFLVSRKLVYKKALADESIDKKELEAVVELQKLNGVATYYLLEKLKNDVTVSDKEVDQFYTENQNIFKGVPMNDEIIARIKQQIFMKKFEMKSNEFILNLIAESKVKKEGLKKYLQEKAKEKPEGDKADAEKKDDKKTENKK